MIEARNLKKTYHTKVKKGLFKREKDIVEAVKGIHLKLEKGQIIGLLGINGAGKTTTIKMLSTLIKATSGEILVDGVEINENPLKIKQKVNMIAGGERMIYWRLTGRENLWYYGQLYGIPDKVLKTRIDRLLTLVGLNEKQNVPVERYSKGMKQRLQIARGLINDPDYLFMDEPTLGLDAPIAREIRTYIKKLAIEEQKGILLTSHYINEVEALCDYIYILDHGEVILEGTAKTLSESTFETKITVLELAEMNSEIEASMQRFAVEENAIIHRSPDAYLIRFESKNELTEALVKRIHSENLPLSKLYVEAPKLEDTIIEISRRVNS
ncbi:ABC transporter ATP-binding protein [Fusibacter ferrireducens]|uniref:ABC transporter ATP-binding protein n=1 Tax=Fusibacter ferrireducens TaxID=2785058 RepID=A0ABR9ZQT8_9FIRM|nr:ABC transporter ATP-binding protein [Fusibacter ferrireducens]MBF4692827.1 ABC transporter ATP-binding protein [Fusibacter ferrireducens]